MCRQSWPRAGSWMRRNVIGHFNDTLMAVCSTPSSPFSPGVPAIEPLLKFLFTEDKVQVMRSTVTEPRSRVQNLQDEERTLGDAVLGRQEPLLHQTLKDGAHRRAVHQLQHEQVRLQRHTGGSD